MPTIASKEIIEVEMSDFQFGVYEEARVQERKVEQNNAKKKAKKGKKREKTQKLG